MTIRIVTAHHGRTHLLRTNNAPHSFETACGRTLRVAMAGTHEAGSLADVCQNCQRTEQGREAIREQWRRDNREAIVMATAYVTSRFYPPLPREYGELAVQAVQACNEGDLRREIQIPDGLNPEPRGTTPDGKITAQGLVNALRLWHMITDEED